MEYDIIEGETSEQIENVTCLRLLDILSSIDIVEVEISFGKIGKYYLYHGVKIGYIELDIYNSEIVITKFSTINFRNKKQILEDFTEMSIRGLGYYNIDFDIMGKIKVDGLGSYIFSSTIKELKTKYPSIDRFNLFTHKHSFDFYLNMIDGLYNSGAISGFEIRESFNFYTKKNDIFISFSL